MTTFNDTCTHDALFGSTDDRPDGGEWATPQAFFDALNAEFGFTLDAAASDANAKCKRYYTKADDSLKQSWEGVVFCNPPYGREIGKWLAKGREAAKQGATVVFLVHARTDTRWFHEHVNQIANEVRFVKGRLKFEHKSGTNQSAPFPSMIVVYRANKEISIRSISVGPGQPEEPFVIRERGSSGQEQSPSAYPDTQIPLAA